MTEYCEFCERNLKAFAKKCWNCHRIFDHGDYVHFGRPDKDPKIEPYTIVKLTQNEFTKDQIDPGIFGDDHKFLFIHEIVNMPGHVYVVGLQSGKAYIGLHEEHFVECDEDEV